jgi:hypothetical protein
MAENNKLSERTVILHMVFHCPPQRRTEKKKRVETEGKQSYFGISKTTLESDAYDKMVSIKNKVRGEILKHALPGTSLAESYHAIPVSEVESVVSLLEAAAKEFAAAVDEFIGEYEACKERAKADLKDAFNEADYDGADRLVRKFWVEWSWQEQSVPGEGKLGKTISEIEIKKERERRKQEGEVVVYALRKSAYDILAHLQERLEPNPDGSKKRLFDSALTNAVEFFQMFRSLNVMDDDEGQKLIDAANAVIKGKKADTLRENDQWRARLAGQVGEIKAKFDVLVTNAPGRRIVLDDDE